LTESNSVAVTFGGGYAADNKEFWSRVGKAGLLPAAGDWGKMQSQNPSAYNYLSMALNGLGSNGAPLIPALIEICDQTVPVPVVKNAPAGPPASIPPANMASISRNTAYQALGKIGVAAPEVIAALNRGLADT